MSALRPRVDFTVVFAGETRTGSTTLKDTMEARKRFDDIEKDADNHLLLMTKVIYCAAERLGMFTGSFEEFVDALEDYEIEEPPPLAKG